MNEQKRALLIKLLDELLLVDYQANLNNLIQQSLKIIAAISEQHSQVNYIAKSLSMIAKIEQKRSLEESLIEDFALIDQGLEAKLRGFSGLLDLVLEENIIKVDVEQIEFSIPDRLQSLAQIFGDLYRQFDAYSCFNLAFGEVNSHALTLLFLIALKRVISYISCDENEAHELIEYWLNTFIKNRAIKETFAAPIDYNNPTQVADYCLDGYEFAKEALTVFLCIASSKPININNSQIIILDKALRRADLLGLDPFVESGFLALA